MIEITNTTELEKYIEKYNIRDMFDTPDLPFKLYRYEIGEMMNHAHPQEKYIKFLVEGTVASDEIDINGNIKRLFEETALAFWGEAEICGYSFSNHLHEVVETAYCIELPLEPFREILLDDKRFLQYLVKRMSGSIYHATHMLSYMNYSIEDRLIYHLKYIYPNHTFSGMDLTAKRLQCSRRQLQRVVNQLVKENKIKKIGKGTYSLY
ncbi:MAG: hypothetical protein IKU39_03200 [Lachnospiraceae bacterium]|nr:hypothetical protein [Lachnospiraceae bacterium]